jgi:hypothetical protein
VTTRELPAELRSTFDDGEIAEIEASKLSLSESTKVDAFDLALSWASKVRKIDLDRGLPWSDRTVWNEHDLAGTLFWRDHLQRSLDQLPAALRTRLQQFVAQAVIDFARSPSRTPAIAWRPSRASIRPGGRGGGTACLIRVPSRRISPSIRRAESGPVGRQWLVQRLQR